jgi:hypothetical protein
MKMTPGPHARRAVGPSKSMHNLASATKAQPRLPSPPPPPLPQHDTAKQPSSNNSSRGSSSGSSASSIAQPASAPPSSPSKQHAVHVTRPGLHGRNLTAPPAQMVPLYDLADEENLPSPFLKKKTSAPPSSVMAAIGAAARVARGAVHRPAPSVPTAGTRAARPAGTGGSTTGTRQSLAGRLALARAAKAEEERQQAAAAAGTQQTQIPRARRESVPVSVTAA